MAAHGDLRGIAEVVHRVIWGLFWFSALGIVGGLVFSYVWSRLRGQVE